MDFKTNVASGRDLALAAGMRYVNITTRHHDSFCLFATKETDFNSVNSPARRDLVAELAKELTARGIRMGVYLPAVGRRESAEVQQKSDAEFKTTIEKGVKTDKGMMPEEGSKLTPEQIKEFSVSKDDNFNTYYPGHKIAMAPPPETDDAPDAPVTTKCPNCGSSVFRRTP